MPTLEERLALSQKPSAEALRLHPFYAGKIQVAPKCAIRGYEDFAIWYTPGVAAPCKAIQAAPELVYEHTNKANSVAIVTDGTRVLGLGDIGPAAGLPVMEGKALLFKYLGGIDAVPICLATKDADEIVRTVKLIAPAFGGINLEDIAQPKCFRILDRARAETDIPVWHDDQQGTATAVLAALGNALEVVGKRRDRVRIVLVGMGAANVAIARLLRAAGFDTGGIVACDRGGVLHRDRHDIESRAAELADKWRLCRESNGDDVRGGIAEALRGADVCLAFSSSGPGVIEPAWVRAMAKDAIVFACANPTPEIWPWDAAEAGARIVATGRSDFPNQVNNSLVFPGVFRGALDVRSSTITDDMALAAADALGAFARARGLGEERLLPRMDEWEAVPQVAAATGLAAIRAGIARLSPSRDELVRRATDRIRAARELTRSLMSAGVIAAPPAP
ncbi:MAG: NADP-dependent malic enzyme [bacterium]